MPDAYRDRLAEMTTPDPVAVERIAGRWQLGMDEAMPLLRRILARSSWYPSGMVTLPAAILINGVAVIEATEEEWRALLRLADSER